MIRAYTKPIKERDRRCFLANPNDYCTDIDHIHHIDSRGSGGLDEYHNLIWLCSRHHLEFAHWKDQVEYKAIFKTYISLFPRPADWDVVMVKSKRQRENYKKRSRIKAKAQYKKQVSAKVGQLKAKQPKPTKPEKSAYQLQKEWFVKKHWMTPSKYQYEKQKAYKKTLNKAWN